MLLQNVGNELLRQIPAVCNLHQQQCESLKSHMDHCVT